MQEQEIRLIENKKRALKRYKKNLACLERLQSKLDNLNDRLTSVRSPVLSGMPRGGQPVTTADLIAEKCELEERIDRLKEKSKKLRAEILSEIDRLEDPRYCEVLESFFIGCKSLEEISDELGYTDRHVYRLYSEGCTFLALTENGQ